MACANPNRVRVGEANITISELCAGQATKIVLNSSAEPMGAHWGEEMAHK